MSLLVGFILNDKDTPLLLHSSQIIKHQGRLLLQSKIEGLHPHVHYINHMSTPISTAFFFLSIIGQMLFYLWKSWGVTPWGVSRTYESYKYYRCFRFAPVNSVLKNFTTYILGTLYCTFRSKTTIFILNILARFKYLNLKIDHIYFFILIETLLSLKTDSLIWFWLSWISSKVEYRWWRMIIGGHHYCFTMKLIQLSHCTFKFIPM